MGAIGIGLYDLWVPQLALKIEKFYNTIFVFCTAYLLGLSGELDDIYLSETASSR